MKNIAMVFLLVMACAATGSAQDATVVFHPGDSVHILVAFKTPSTFDGAVFSFGLIGQPDKKQEGLGLGFQGNQFKKISDTQVEITGTVPEHSASGTYRLNWINITIKAVGKQYNEGSDFKELTITVLNPEHPEFPVIDDVRLAPRN